MKKFLLFISFCLLCLTQMSAATETWVKVTTEPTDWSGDYLIVYEDGSVAFDGSLPKLDVASNTQAVTISNSTITTTDCKFYFTIAAINGGYSIKSQSGYYIGRTNSTKNGLDSSTSTQYVNTISLSGGTLSIENGNATHKLRYNSASNQNRFRYFTSSQQAVALYKKQEGEPTVPTQVATPTFSPASGSSVKYGSIVTVSSVEGTKLVVSYGDVLLEEVGTNKKDITLPAENSGVTEYTISAYAVDANGTLDKSETAEATYTLYNETVKDIAAFLKAADAVNARTINSDATVVWKESNKKLYVKDDSGWLLLYNNGSTFTDEYTNGDVIKAGYKGTYFLLNNSTPEMNGAENIVKGEAVAAIAPTEVSSLDDYDACFCNEYIVLKKVTLTASNSKEVTATFENGSTVIVYYSEAVTYDGTKFYDVEGFKLLYGTKKEVTPKEIKELSLPALAVFTDENGEPVTGGIVKQGSYINYSWESGCSAKVYYNDVLEAEYTATEPSSGSWSVDAKKYAVGAEVTIKIEVTNEIGTTTATATFTVENPYKVSDKLVVDDITTSGTSYTTFSGVIKNGAEYAGRVSKNGGIQLNYSNTATDNKHGVAIFMTQSVGTISTITLNIKSNKGIIYIYGQDEPYIAYSTNGTGTVSKNESYIYSDKSNLGENIAEISTTGIKTISTVGKKYIIILSSSTAVLNSVEVEWEDAFEYGKDITYEMQSETTKLTEGKFVTLVDTKNKIAVSRNNAAEGTIAGAAASIAEADENSNTSLYLGKGQFSIDEFELVPVLGGGFKLYGGGSITRRYIGVDETGLTTTADENDKAVAVVTLESDGKGVVVKFADGDIIVSDGTNFGKGKASTESATSLAGGATLVPAYVFVSPGEDSTGVEDIEMVETEAPAQYYNLNGVEVKAGNLVPGIYIVRQGNKVSKQFIR